MSREYTTKEIADIIGIHVNTVRFYEEQGFLTPPKRLKNGYRIYTVLQLEQCRVVRMAMRAEVLQNGLRNQVVKIVRLCANLDMDASLREAYIYQEMIQQEINNARAAITTVEQCLNRKNDNNDIMLKRIDAAKVLGVTPETLRTWERSNLINIKRSQNGYRVYSGEDMERLNIIRTLRCAGYSLSAILRLLCHLDGCIDCSVEVILNTPEEDEDIISVCDRLIISLQNTAVDAKKLVLMLKGIAGIILTNV